MPSVEVYATHVAEPNSFEDHCGVSGKGEPALQCRRQIYAPDSSSLKPGSGAIEGVLD